MTERETYQNFLV